METNRKKIILLILDGWGLSPAWNGNAIKMADPPNFNYLWQSYPRWVLKTLDLKTHNQDIIETGLGYSVISCGRHLPSTRKFIGDKIANNELVHNNSLAKLLDYCRSNSSALHLCGLLSDSGEISDYKQIFPIFDLAHKLKVQNAYLHLIIDDDRNNNLSQCKIIDQIGKYFEDKNYGKIASLTGRSKVFDGESNFENVIKTYKTIALGEGKRALDAKQAIQQYNERYIENKSIPPTVILENNKPVGKLNDFDGLVFFNFDDISLRSLSSIFIGQDKAIRRKEVYNINVATFTDYFYLKNATGYDVIFERDDLTPNLSQILNENNISQLYLSQDFRNQHLNYYFKGGNKRNSGNQSNIIVPSNESDLGLRPLMYNLISEIKKQRYSFIAATIGNCDFIAHLKHIKEVAESVKEVDSYLCQLELAALESGYMLFVTSDHGFIEQLSNSPSLSAKIGHSKNPVPLIMISKDKAKQKFENAMAKDLYLSDILTTKNSIIDTAPTILKEFNIDPPHEMVGNSLI